MGESEQQESNPQLHGYKPCALPLNYVPIPADKVATSVGRAKRRFCYDQLLPMPIINLSHFWRT